MVHLTIAVASTFYTTLPSNFEYQLSGGSPKDPLCRLEGDLSADFDAIGPGDAYPYTICIHMYKDR